jgi:acyl phosphate:glycerol-3-phosphate acyltransferase
MEAFLYILRPLSYVLAAYLIGSISTAILLCRLFKLPDPRTQGSKNPGATNVLRFGGKKLAFVVLLGDALKGFLAVWLVKWLGAQYFTIGMAGFAAFLGHLYPIYFRFQGGKGVATALGVWLAFSWWLGLAAMAIWLVSALVSRLSSLGAVIMTLAIPGPMLGLLPPAYWPGVVSMCIFLLWRHRVNINRIFEGTEPKIGKKSTNE